MAVSTQTPGKLRIIGGQWRSRLLPVPALEGLRPTPDRVRETLFNWLQYDIAGARCLDLFAGSGALAFEAASRGAESVIMLENQPAAAQLLAQNIQTLQADTIQLLQRDAISWLNSYTGSAFDIVFLDPPFASQLLAEACRLLAGRMLLTEQACIYLEMNSHQTLPELPVDWHVTRQKKAGQVSYYLVRRNFNPEP